MSAIWSNDPEPASGGTVTRPQCMNCVHRRTLDTCTAFPGGIPVTIIMNAADHRKPFEGDHGIRWDPADDDAIHPLAN